MLNQKYKGILYKTFLIGLLWIGVAIFISSITFLNQLQGNFTLTLSAIDVVLFEIVCISPWAVSTPFIARAARRYSFSKDSIYMSLGVHVLIAFIVFCFHSVVQSAAVDWFYNEPFTYAYLLKDFWGFIDMRLLLYTGLLLGIYTIDFQRKNRKVKLHEVAVKRELNRAKFQALLNQIQPDFLLSSIDLIHESLDRNLDEAEQTLTDLSDLLRIMLNRVHREEVTVQEDLESYQLYINLLRNRLNQNFESKTDVDDACYDVLIPSFLQLVPLFEGMIHALKTNNGMIEQIDYKAHKKGEHVQLQVVIKGKKLPQKQIPELIRKTDIIKILQRLESTFGRTNHFKTETSQELIRIGLTVPFRQAEEISEREKLMPDVV